MNETKEIIELNDIIPQEAEFFLKSKSKSFKLRKITLRDRAWIKDKFKDDIERIFSTTDFSNLIIIIYHQLTDECKKDFLAITRKCIDDDGVEKEIFVKGYELLSEAISDPKEIRDVMMAFMLTMGLSQPIIDKVQESELKKNEAVKV